MRRTSQSFKKQGFTIVELLVVIVVIGILASVTIVSFGGVQTKAAVVVVKSDLSQARSQLDIYNTAGNGYPVTQAAAAAEIRLSPGTTFVYATSNANQDYCMTMSSVKAKTSFHYDSTEGVIADGPCV